MDEIHIQQISGPTVAEMDVEIVECKGLGHPDTICDSVMERISQALSSAYIERFGAILHHNCDKGLLVAGRVERRFGGGDVVEPMRLGIGDRATSSVGEKHISGLKEIIVWLSSRIGDPVDRPQMVSVQMHLQPGASISDIASPIRQMVKEELARIPVFCKELAEGRYPIC